MQQNSDLSNKLDSSKVKFLPSADNVTFELLDGRLLIYVHQSAGNYQRLDFNGTANTIEMRTYVNDTLDHTNRISFPRV